MSKQTAEHVRRKMLAVKSSGSLIEKRLSKSLWDAGYHYRKNDKTVQGTPDLTFKQLKIAIFVDSEFWHGKNWKIRKHDHKTNVVFWHNKIEQNIARDKIVNKILKNEGWKVLRFWGVDIKKHLEDCIQTIEKTIELAKNKQ